MPQVDTHHNNQDLVKRLKLTAHYIANLQLPSGAIPWFEDGITDPWDHVEGIMGLTTAGFYNEALNGLKWLEKTQLPNGAWYAAYRDDEVADANRAESNFVAYPATGLWHYYLATKDMAVLRRFWPMIRKAMLWVTSLQTQYGDICWAYDFNKGISQDALITGCSSIFKSLECTILIAETLNFPTAGWQRARTKLGTALLQQPNRFDRTWASKARFSMDWFYPILSGVITGPAAQQRLSNRWDEFVVTGLGCHCVNDEPWVTVAESCELIMSCVAAGEAAKGQVIFENLMQFQLENGAWWTGYAYKDRVHWPDERPTWTAAAVLLAADALQGQSSTASLFTKHLPILSH